MLPDLQLFCRWQNKLLVLQMCSETSWRSSQPSAREPAWWTSCSASAWCLTDGSFTKRGAAALTGRALGKEWWGSRCYFVIVEVQLNWVTTRLVCVCVVGTVKVNDNSLLKCICVRLKYDIILGGWSTIKGFLFLYESLHCGWTKYNDEAQDKAYNDINHNQINNDFQWVFERGIIIIGNSISCLKL